MLSIAEMRERISELEQDVKAHKLMLRLAKKGMTNGLPEEQACKLACDHHEFCLQAEIALSQLNTHRRTDWSKQTQDVVDRIQNR